MAAKKKSTKKIAAKSSKKAAKRAGAGAPARRKKVAKTDSTSAVVKKTKKVAKKAPREAAASKGGASPKPSRGAATVAEYLAQLPDDRRAGLEAVRAVILKNLPKGYEERMQYGMIGYCVPHSIYPAGYHCDTSQPLPFGGLASQKGHMSLYLMGLYMSEDRLRKFQDAWKASGKKLDMGKSCIRFKKVEDVPLGVVGEAVRGMPVKEYIAVYEGALGGRKTR